MSEPHAFVFIKCEDQVALGRAILRINLTRRQQFFYRSLVLSAPRRGWIAILLGEGGGLIDHLLLRNLSGKLETLAFELRLGRFDVAYRLHREGRTVAAFESNLPYYVNHRLRMIETADDVTVLDLGEPIERFVLKRYHDLQHPNAAITLSLRLPDALHDHYAGTPELLRPLLRYDADVAYIQRLLTPGYNPERVFEHLMELLDLPYLPQDDGLTIPSPDGTVQKIDGLAITRPATWHDYTLPSQWRRMPAVPPKKTNE
jgi:hypothetical protein